MLFYTLHYKLCEKFMLLADAQWSLYYRIYAKMIKHCESCMIIDHEFMIKKYANTYFCNFLFSIFIIVVASSIW